MSEKIVNFERRRLMKMTFVGMVAVPVNKLLLQGTAYAETLPHLSEEDSSARALNYVHDTGSLNHPKFKAGRMCKNCNLIQGGEGEWRRCSIFPGKAVNQNGWCIAWVGRI